ncbi:MarR family transcriptional regulator [Pseudomonas sp. RIT-To-2]|uniref:MarR family transcriptional regulator n=1 Tax=Pseudomonas sp. RIT-To-2 TaxID=3462541 RepID=UPI0024132C58
MNQRLEPCGLSITQFHVLDLLVNNQASLPAHLSDALNISASGITTVVDQLERKQLLERLRKQPDRRTVRLCVSALGTRLHTHAHALLAHTDDNEAHALPSSYFVALNSLLKAL